MANTPFNQQITNALERPTSSGLNIGMANYDVQALAYSLMQSTIGSGSSGFVGSSFKVRPYTPGATDAVVLTRGVGFYAGSGGTTDIGGISGLNDFYDYKVMHTDTREIALQPPCTPGKIRRDLIMIKSKATLADYAATDIYQPSVNSFSAQNRPRTLNRDFSTETVWTLAATATPAANQYLVYKVGQEVDDYLSLGNFLDAPIPTVDPGYMGIAVINVSDAVPVGGYTESRINDIRALIAPGGTLSVDARATVGSTGSGLSWDVGGELSSVDIQTPPGLTAAMYKAGYMLASKRMLYYLYVFGPQTLNGIIGNAELRNFANFDSDNFSYGSIANIIDTSQVVVDIPLQAELTNSTRTVPAVNVAVGQVAWRIVFGVGTPYYDPAVSPTTKMYLNYAAPFFGKVGGSDQATSRVNLSLNFVL